MCQDSFFFALTIFLGVRGWRPLDRLRPERAEGRVGVMECLPR